MKDLEENKFIELISKTPNVAVQGYDKQRRVIYWNKASEFIYGYSKEEALGKKLEDLIIPDFMKDDVVNAINDWYKNGNEIPAGELPLKHKNGSTVYVYSSHVMLNENSNSPEMFCIDVDVSQKIEKEEELKIKDELLLQKSKMASLGEMLDNIAHQWRQPLSMISCSAAGIQFENDYKKLTDDYLDKSIGSIIDTTKYLSQTIDDFRGFIRGTHEKVNFVFLDNVQYSLRLLDAQIKKNFLNVVLSTPIDDIKMYGYPNELVQVIINIFSNAKDTFKEREIEDRYIFINIKQKDENVLLSIKDTAGGISDEVINRVFEQNFTTKKNNKGTGIGLYMSKKLVHESMHGLIEVKNCIFTYENKEYKGAEFIVTLPIKA